MSFFMYGQIMFGHFCDFELRLKNVLLTTQQFFKQERIQSNANHPLAESMDYIKFEGM